MKTLLKVFFVLFLIVAILVGGSIAALEWYLHSPGFKQKVIAAIQQPSSSTQMRFDDFDLSLFRGLTVKGLTGQHFTADAFVVRPRWLPLLRRQVVFSDISLQRPALTIIQNVPGPFIPLPGELPSSSGGGASRQLRGWELVCPNIAVNDADVVILNSSNQTMGAFHKLDFHTSLSVKENGGTGAGALKIGSLVIGKSVAIQNIESPVAISPQAIELTTLRGALGGGTISGAMTFARGTNATSRTRLEIRDADLGRLTQKAGSPRVLNGKLQATFAMTGDTGNGRIEVTGGSTKGLPLMSVLSLLLRAPVLNDLKLDDCRMEFTVATNQMQTPLIRFHSPEAELTGKGTVSLADGSLNHEMTLFLSDAVATNAPGIVRKMFTQQADGRQALRFHVGGTYDAPRLDIEERVLQNAAEKVLDKLQKFLNSR